ncbi:MAG TPA: glycoside hydrolase family 2 TIM barrel-domain containing protein, partial [Vicinamibacterales bacterium]
MNDGRHLEASRALTRRAFVRSLAAGAATLVSSAALVESAGGIFGTRLQRGAVHQTIPLTDGWLFGGRLTDAALARVYDESRLERVRLPHCVTKLSWREWDPERWESEWVYRRHIGLTSGVAAQRIFLRFDGVMVGATPVVNDHRLPTHLGAYLPFEYEITQAVMPGDNVLAIAVDSRWTNVPPEGSPRGPRSIDYLEPGGIPRPVTLRVVPHTFISDVFARSTNVLDPSRRLEVTCSIDAAVPSSRPLRMEARLLDGSRVVARADDRVTVEHPGLITVDLTLSNIRDVKLWHIDSPQLYDIVVRLLAGETTLHEYRSRIGLRDARFETDGFFLNGRRLRIFGLNRHELYPYVGFAMPARALRRDAELLRHTLNCNFVRCSHYPQSEAFLDACDELGLMVWEELPGWQYLGDESWQDRAVADVREMVIRDRNRPSIAIWGVRINESANNPPLYRRTKDVAKALDPTRATSGTMTKRSTENWLQEVFAYDNYEPRPDGSVN